MLILIGTTGSYDLKRSSYLPSNEYGRDAAGNNRQSMFVRPPNGFQAMDAGSYELQFDVNLFLSIVATVSRLVDHRITDLSHT